MLYFLETVSAAARAGFALSIVCRATHDESSVRFRPLPRSAFPIRFMANKTSKPTPTLKGSKPISAARTPTRRLPGWVWIAVGAGVALLVILAVVALVANRPRTTTPTGSTVAEQVGQPVDRRLLGRPDAPVVVVAYEDFQCPHCQDFSLALEGTIRELVAAGTIRFEFKPRFVIGPESVTAMMAAECAADQGRFWEYHDALFAALKRNPRANQISDFEKLAVDIGLDSAAFNRCLEGQQHKEALLREDIQARDDGINATPTVFINGKRYQGRFDPAEFRAAVEQALQEAGS